VKRILSEILAALIVLAGITFLITRGERAVGAAIAERDAARDSARVARRDLQVARTTLDATAAALVEQTADWRVAEAARRSALNRAGGFQRILDSLRARGPIHETTTVAVPVEVLVTSETAARACSTALETCERLRIDAETERDAARRLRTADSTQIEKAKILEARPWTAIGVSAAATGLGLSLDRDLSRLRIGGSAGIGRAELRISIRF
jgi:ElaB/YqjD/DUF883 family membrane-anchored ribosome-binding protein